MAFICERVKQEDWEFFNSIGFISVYNSLIQASKWRWWVIDRDRNIIMTSIGGVREEPWTGYQLYLDGYFVNMIVERETEGSRFDYNLKINWIIKELEIPQELMKNEDCEKKVREIVREAFVSEATCGLKESQLIGVTVEFKNSKNIEWGE